MVVTTIDFKTIPLSALRLQSRHRLSIYLDAIKILFSSDGKFRDWRGVFHLCGLTNEYEQFLSGKESSTFELLKCLEKKPHHITFFDFRKILGDIDRWDVVDDTYEMFVEDAIEYLKEKEKFDQRQEQLTETSKRKLNPDILTNDDVILAANNLPLQQYDAFILFADNDIDFATEMIEKVESSGFKLCVKQRDFLDGVSFEQDAIAILRLLTERCGQLIVILSEDFIASPLNGFISSSAQSLGIAQRKRKIIPCLYKECKQLPEMFQHIHLLKYQNSEKTFFNFWKKLENSLKRTPEERMAIESSDRIISPDSIKKFWPQPPPLGPSTSMINLTDLDLHEPNNNNVEQQRLKKRKWYNRLSDSLTLTIPCLRRSGNDTKLSKEKNKNKSNIWHRKRLAGSNKVSLLMHTIFNR